MYERHQGDLVASRFVLEEVAGSGGMGTVYRARDTQDDRTVALKLLHDDTDAAANERFARESRLLAELHHPEIVRWIAHGVDASGHRYLAMEWLEGEGLNQLLKRARPSIDESISLVRRIAGALGAAHRIGVVHRDLKPSNVFLVGGRLDRPKLLDFGVAKPRGGDGLRTATGAVLGTPGYMSPEQARGERDVDARSDVFSLGVFLHRCLAGKLPFEGRDALALLMRVILDEPPRLRDLRPDVPAALEELVLKMLAKSPEQRPANAQAVADALELEGGVTIDLSPSSAAEPAASAITTGEQRLLCAVLMRVVMVDDDAATMDDPSGSLQRLRRLAASFGGTLDALVDGSIVVTFASGQSLSEQAVRAARCALGLRELVPYADVALAAGRADLSTGSRVGDVIDRAVQLLGRGGDRAIRLDDVTSSLLEARFAIGADERGLFLRGESGASAVRTLLGKPTTIVGRDRELQNLESILDECVGEPVARAVLVTAPAGFGKSRVRYELLRRIDRRDDRIDVWSASGDPLSAGAPYAMISPVIKRAAGILDGEPLVARRDRLRARVARHVGASEVQRVAEFLGELVGAPFEEESPQLRNARREPMVMGDQIRRAWEDFTLAECGAHPVLLVLEDLHWGDSPSVRLLDTTLRLLADFPFMVLALARPEIEDDYPKLWSERGVVHVRLGELTRRAAERLVREALGAIDARGVERIVERAQGNAFYLEELIRAAAEGKVEALPGTVLGMVQARLEALGQDERRLLRGAAVFGHTFHRGGVVALLGGEPGVDDMLRDLAEREIVSERTTSRFPGEREYTFRHALVRDAAYAMLIDDDCKLGHRLAAEWLESVGETAAMVLAEQWERAGQPERASQFYQRAAQDALEANDFAAAIERADRAIAHAASAEERGSMLTLQASAHRWRGEFEAAEERGALAASCLAKGSTAWCRAMSEVAITSGRRGNRDLMLQTARDLLEAVVASQPNSERIVAAITVVNIVYYTGATALAIEFMHPLEEAAEPLAASEPFVAARLQQMRVAIALAAGDLSTRRRWSLASIESFRRAGDLRMTCAQQINLGYVHITMGRNQEAVDGLIAGLGEAERLGLANVAAVAKHNLGLAFHRLGRLDEARAFESAAVREANAHGDRRVEAGSRAILALIHLDVGDVEAAQREVEHAIAITDALPPGRAHALAVLALVLLGRGLADDAMGHARRARELLAELGHIDDGESVIYLALVEALRATGQAVAARQAAIDARDWVHAVGERIAVDEREPFFTGVPENARILALAAALT